MLKNFLKFVTGAGKGYAGSFIRTLVAAVGGVLVTQGYLDEDVASALMEHVIGFGLILLALVGSRLNNEEK